MDIWSAVYETHTYPLLNGYRLVLVLTRPLVISSELTLQEVRLFQVYKTAILDTGVITPAMENTWIGYEEAG